MKVLLEWTDEDIRHIRRHNIEPEEVESIFQSRIYYKRRKNYYVLLDRLEVNVYRVAIARSATSSEKDFYTLKGRDKYMKKIKAKGLEDLPETDEWSEVEFTEPVEVKSVVKKTAKTKA